MRKLLLALSVAGFLAILSSTASKSPTLPLFAKELGAGPGEIGIIAAASTITGIVVNVVAGTLSDVYGRKALLIASGFFLASAPFLYLLVTNPLQLIAVRVYHGVATAVFTPVAAAAVADAYAERRGEAMGLLSSATLVGRLIAPFSAGLFISFYSFRGAYLFCAAVGVAAFITLTTAPPLPRPRRGALSAVRSLSEALLNP